MTRIKSAIFPLVLLPLLAAASPAREEWKSLFDGKSLGNWKKTDFAAGGDVKLDPKFKGGDPAIVVEMGDTLSGFNWKTNDDGKPTDSKAPEIPKTNYEISLEFMKLDGTDFACGLTFPVGDSFASLILGGWGGGVVGISSIDNLDASENSTTRFMGFAKDKWFKVRMRVTAGNLSAWLDDKQVIDADIKGKKIDLRSGEISKSKPLGIATFRVTAAFRNIKIRKLDPKELETKGG